MTVEAILAIVNTALKVLDLAIKAGASVKEITADIGKIKSWADGSVKPTAADKAALRAREDELLAIINDTSKDDPS